MATYFPFKRGGPYNAELLRRIEGRPLFRMFLSLDAMNNLDHGASELVELVNHRQVAGIKLYPDYQDFRLSNPRVFPVYELAEKNNLPTAIHTGELHHYCPKSGEIRFWC